MRIQGFEVVRFGKLRDLVAGTAADSGPLEDLVVVCGPNESGKTTLFRFLSALLYGFYPASRDSNPYTPWDGGDIEGRLQVRTSDGACLDIHRRLLSSPTGSLLIAEREKELRNRSLPVLAHVPRDVFEQVYALTLFELSEIADAGSGGWRKLQDRLLLGMGARDVETPGDVADTLEAEAGALWRSNKRGNQEIRDIDRRIAELRARRREAADRDRTLRSSARRLEEVREELRDARREVERLRIVEERVDRLRPLRERMKRLRSLEEATGEEGLLENLPADPEERLETLRSRSGEEEEALEALGREADELALATEGYGRAEERLVDREARIRSLAARAGGASHLLTGLGGLEQDIRDVERTCRAHARDLFTTSLDGVDAAELARVPVTELRDAVRRYRRQREEERIEARARRRARARTPPAPRIPVWVVIGLALLSVALLAAGLFRWDFLMSAGVALGGATVVLLVVRLRETDARADGVAEDDASAGGNAAAATAASGAEAPEGPSEILRLLNALPVSASRLRDPDLELVRSLEALQEGIEEIRERRERLVEHRESLARLAEEAAELGEECGIQVSEDPAAATALLGRALDEARSVRERAKGARRRLERVTEERKRVERRAEKVRLELDALEERLRKLGGGDLDAGLHEAKRRLAARNSAEVLQREMLDAHPDLESDLARIREAEERGEPWTLDDEGRATNRTDMTELQARIEALAREEEALSGTLRQAGSEETVDQIDGVTEELKERRERLVRQRDRKWLMARLIREADRRYRDRHQPEVIQRAGDYVRTITGGTYDGLTLADGSNGDGLFRLRPASGARRVSLESPLSAGVRDQVYLALRLAAVDQLDAAGERLPLFIDEAFVNWDPARRERGFRLLAQVAARRQVFVFTCHPGMAAELEERGGRVLHLDERGDGIGVRDDGTSARDDSSDALDDHGDARGDRAEAPEGRTDAPGGGGGAHEPAFAGEDAEPQQEIRFGDGT